MNKGEDIQNMLIDFAVDGIRVAEKLPRSIAGRHIASQLVRSSTSGAPNYAEARSAESRKDFIHKLRIVLKELNESAIWLKMILRARLLKEAECRSFLESCESLCRIIGKSVATSKKNINDIHQEI